MKSRAHFRLIKAVMAIGWLIAVFALAAFMRMGWQWWSVVLAVITVVVFVMIDKQVDKL